ncbi:MAG: nucleotidyl transferase AbiEii/AbiGii toxin family protein [Spirochaetes bacterium]|nr:nucleotidyl transferase AbiEii/AbiGii toxin family protein [Spirochaetota bacterium]
MDIPHDIIGTLKTLSSVCTAHGMRYCLVGGLAVSIVAAPRATEDIDITLLINADELPRLREILNAAFDIIQFNEERLDLSGAFIQRVVIRGKNSSGFVILDVLLPVHPIYRQAVERAIPLSVDNVIIPVARPEDLILMKMLSKRPQDVADIETIRRECDGLDESYISSNKPD